MAINFDSIISNTKGAANIAKLKVTLGLKTNELNKLYTELGKLGTSLRSKCRLHIDVRRLYRLVQKS